MGTWAYKTCGASLWKIVASFTTFAAFYQVEAAPPAAIAVQVDETQWIGNDGLWSPIVLGIGSPIQQIDLFPSTTGQETLVIGTDGCTGNAICLNSRGGNFASNVSTTFQADGNYAIGSDRTLGGTGAGFYGLDTITIPDQGTIMHQIVGIINSTEYWVGLLGLGIKTTFSGKSNSTSFLASLAGGNSPLIPSLSYGFTAGAHYRLKQVPSSLTLGGYDANRVQPSSVTFSLSDSQEPSLFLQDLSMSGFGDTGSTKLLGQNENALFTIDSSTSYLWLPEFVATRLGDHLGLVYNDTLDLFVYPNSSHYNAIANSQLTFNFGFSDQSNSPTELTLDVDGRAFTTTNISLNIANLSASAEIDAIPYFPVRKASNATQYTLGRAFLQEVYLIVDYQRNHFTLAEAIFNSTATMEIVDILPPSQTSSTNSFTNVSSRPLSVGAEAGIAVGVSVFSIGVLAAIYRNLIRRRPTKIPKALLPAELSIENGDSTSWRSYRGSGSEPPVGNNTLCRHESSQDQSTPSNFSERSHSERLTANFPDNAQSPSELLGAPLFPVAELPDSSNTAPYTSQQLRDGPMTTSPSQMSSPYQQGSRASIDLSQRTSEFSEMVPIYHILTPK